VWFAIVLVSVALSAPPAPASQPPRGTPERVVITRPRGFAWREALVGSFAAGVAVALVAGADTKPS
jgi:hypothetical protein